MLNFVYYLIDYYKENKIDFNKWWVGFKIIFFDFIFISISNCVVFKSGFLLLYVLYKKVFVRK